MRNAAVGALGIFVFALGVGLCYIVASLLGGHTDDDKGDIILAIPFALAAAVIASLCVVTILAPAMFASDFAKAILRWSMIPNLLLGIASACMLYSPWYLTGSSASAESFGLFLAALSATFAVYWAACRSADAAVVFLRRRVRPNQPLQLTSDARKS